MKIQRVLTWPNLEAMHFEHLTTYLAKSGIPGNKSKQLSDSVPMEGWSLSPYAWLVQPVITLVITLVESSFGVHEVFYQGLASWELL